MELSIIIPVLNEIELLEIRIRDIRQLLASYQTEIIVVDGGSTDGSVAVGRQLADCWISSSAGRAIQMNQGAAVAKGRWLYFLHADTIPPAQLIHWIERLDSKQQSSGCFQLQFNQPTLLLRSLSYFTRFNLNAFRFGDQSLLVLHSTFISINGYDESFQLMEGNDIIRRLKKQGGFVVLPDYVITSSRKYTLYGAWYLQGAYTLIYILQRMGFSQKQLIWVYGRLLRKPGI